MATVVRIVSVRTGREVSRVELADDESATYSGGESAAAAVRAQMRAAGQSEAEAIATLAVTGWSNGYLMVDLST
jgi:ATP-dependent protease HslVU (ClpYQ) peptidase subunit